MTREERNKINELFDSHISKGGDIRQFLHLPKSAITPEIQTALDNFLADEGYRHITMDEMNVHEDMVVYREGEQFIFFNEYDKKLAFLEELLKHFEEKLEYEKCAKIKLIINTLKNGRNK